MVSANWKLTIPSLKTGFYNCFYVMELIFFIKIYVMNKNSLTGYIWFKTVNLAGVTGGQTLQSKLMIYLSQNLKGRYNAFQ
jgi:hypothetical protein